MQIIKQTYLINAPVSEVWQALVNHEYIDKWGGGPAKMDAQTGTQFSLWGGSIWGKNIEVIPETKLVQDWYSETENAKWDQPSHVEFLLNPVDKNSVWLILNQTDVPDADFKDIDQGWKDYYLGPLKDYIEKHA